MLFSPLLFIEFFSENIYIRNVDDLWPEVFYDLNIATSGIIEKNIGFRCRDFYRTQLLYPGKSRIRKTLTIKYNVPEEKIHVIEHGVDTRRFDDQKLYLPSLQTVKRECTQGISISDMTLI